MIEKIETLVIGAGVIGSSVAMHLAKKGMTGIRVIDLDLEGSLSSSELNAGGVRATWIQPINVALSKNSIEYFASIAKDVGYNACGYLWLHSPERIDAALQARNRQVAAGWPVEVLDTSELRRKVEFLDKTDGIAGAIFAPKDGLINTNLLKNHFRTEARQMGVQFDDRSLLRSATYHSESNYPIHLCVDRWAHPLTHDAKMHILTQDQGRHPDATSVEYQARYVINCAGAWAPQVAKILGYHCPSYPVRRQVCIFDSRDVELSSYGMIVDTSGVYFHPEATNGLAGFANTNEPHGINFHYDAEHFFNEIIWPALYERSTRFERLKHLTGWAGLYEVSPDECGIVGPCVDTQLSERVFEAHSFSGHGVMQSYSVGLALAEKIILKRYETIDAAPLAANRFETGQLIHENLVI